MTLREWLTLRAGSPAGSPSVVAGGPSFLHVLGWVLVMLMVFEAGTGLALSAFYSPSATDAWASVAGSK